MHVGVRVTFNEGTVIEFTHNPKTSTYSDPEEWAARVIASKVQARRERFESDVPVDRTVHSDGSVEDRLVAE